MKYYIQLEWKQSWFKLQVNVTKQLQVTGALGSFSLEADTPPVSVAGCQLLDDPERQRPPQASGCSVAAPLCTRRLWTRSPLYSETGVTIKLQLLLKWAGSHRVPEHSPVPSWCSRRYSLEWPLTAARSSCWSCPGASAQLSVKHFAYLHCHNSQIKLPLHVCAHLRCAGLAVSHLWRPVERPAS